MNNKVIIQKAAELIKAVNDSGRTILDKRIAEGFGSLDIFIFGNERIQVCGYPSDSEKIEIEGYIDFKVW